jgi:N,N-dimethylformamidase
MWNAAHFHEDDLEDAAWQESFSVTVPQDWPSGVYAVKLEAQGAQDHVPFFVRRATGNPGARVAVQLPTFSYLVYGDDALDEKLVPPGMMPLANMHLQREDYDYLARNGLRSMYDRHLDGSGICHSTMLRPQLTTMRPRHRARLFDAPHQLSADLYLFDWLDARGIACDVITDHCLHREGREVMRHYPVVLSGSHPEYWSREMLDALGAYLDGGGRYMYLGGNGLYWVTALDPRTGTVAEIRRANGTRSWHAPAGEAYLSFTGEMGGLWAWRGRPPQRYVGVGMAAQGFDRGSHYVRTAASRDPRAAFIFAGVEGETIGEFPALTLRWGAAGYELDRADAALGTPPHALIVASAAGFSDAYQHVVEEVAATTGWEGGTRNPNVRADMVFFETPNDGAVFSVGSISWTSALSWNNYDNDVSRITENVVRAFAASGSLPRGDGGA